MQNHGSEIHSLIPVECWQHCLGVENPADIPSIGTPPLELLANAARRDEPSIPPPSVWTFEDEGVQSEESMSPECMTELHASERHLTVGLLTRDMCGISNIVNIEDFSKQSCFLGIVTQVLRFCSILRKRVKPDCPTTFDREMAETFLIKSVQGSLKENKNLSQWEKQLRVFIDQRSVMRCQGRIENADTVPYS